MKKRLQGIIIGVLVCAILFSVSVLAAGNSKMIEAFYTGIRLFVDGGEYIPTDANGKVVEPFIYNGTTYLPVRAVANAFGKDVIWDGANQIVYLGKKDQNQPDNYLDRLQYVGYRESDNSSWFSLVNSITDYNGKEYKGGILFSVRAGRHEGWQNCEMDYALNSQYSKLCGTIVLPKSYVTSGGSNDKPGTAETTVIIYNADNGEELFRVDGVFDSMPYNFDISVKGVNKITIKVEPEKDDAVNYVALTNLALYK